MESICWISMAEPTISSVQITVGLSQTISSYPPAHLSCDFGAFSVVTSENANLVQRIEFYELFMYCMYVSMYVRVSLYFINIILDIALIHHLPKPEKWTRLGPASDWVEQEKNKTKQKNLWSQQDYKIQHRNHVCTETACHCLQKLGLNYPDYWMDWRPVKETEM